MVCDTCRNLLGRQEGRFAQGTLDIRYEHHTHAKAFQQAVRQYCYICRALFRSILAHLQYSTVQPRGGANVSKCHPLDEVSVLSSLAQKHIRSKAFLSLANLDHNYRLEFELRLDETTIRHTFYLESRPGFPASPDQQSAHVRYRTLSTSRPTSRTPSTPTRHRDYDTAKKWLKECRCYASQPRSLYPTRLLSLKSVKASIAKYGNSASFLRGPEVVVRLIETSSWLQADGRNFGLGRGDKQYVSLSHCWGGKVSHRLLRSNYNDYIRGIPVDDLPKSFQDAIYFASSLQEVDFIWIDSLCIIQEDTEDWLKEAAVMGRVYNETYLNLSATSAVNSTGGLFKNGDFELLKEEEIKLDIEGLPMAYDRKAVPQNPDHRKQFLSRQCTISDASFWENTVDKGPVNTRGWVVQERLLSPRVIHFCLDQIGWECGCRDATRSPPISGMQSSKIVDRQTRHVRTIDSICQRTVKKNNYPDIEFPITISAFDLWAAVVNVYTKTAITDPTDKLIALSGLARAISKEIDCAYIAGLWRKHLASQLLWHVEPVFHASSRTSSHPATCATKYRAPSFSWAAIDVIGRGITYARATSRGILVRIEDCSVEPLTDDLFGVVSKARITLWGLSRRARLVSLPGNRFGWYLVGCSETLDSECHTNVYLDCPQRDADCFDKKTATIYVLPIALQDAFAGTSRNEYLVCLLLRPAHEKGVFKRIGITRLSPNADRAAMRKSVSKSSSSYEILGRCRGDLSLPHTGGFDEKTGIHRISLI